MAKRTHRTLLAETVRELDAAIELTSRAAVWQARLQHFQPARFKKRHFSQIAELAYMRLFLAWEAFLEEAFILYLLGKKSPSGYSPVRYATATNRKHASDLLSAEARHADWTAASRVISRAARFFRDGQPFAPAIRPHSNWLDNMKTIRNALSHASDESAQKFETLVRNELTFLPPGTTPGTFLMTLRPNQAPPQTYLQIYAENLRSMAERIVPS